MTIKQLLGSGVGTELSFLSHSFTEPEPQKRLRSDLGVRLVANPFGGYFHSQTFRWWFPASSLSGSHTPGTSFSLASFGESLCQITPPRQLALRPAPVGRPLPEAFVFVTLPDHGVLDGANTSNPCHQQLVVFYHSCRFLLIEVEELEQFCVSLARLTCW